MTGPRGKFLLVKGEGRVNVWTLRVFILVISLAVVATSAGPADAQVPVTLQAAVSSALSQHPSVAVAQQGLAVAEAALAEARAGRDLEFAVAAGAAYGDGS